MGSFPGLQAGDVADAAMARWLQSAGLQHLASPTASPSVDPRHLPSLLMQDYARHGLQNLEDRQKMFRIVKSMSGGMEPPTDPFTPPNYGSWRRNGVDGLSSLELHGDIAGGILDLHSLDDVELLSEDVTHEPFEVSPFVTMTERGFENESEAFWSTSKPPSSKQRFQTENNPLRASSFEREVLGKDSTTNLARIKVVVRKRPLNKKEVAPKQEDIVTIDGSGSSLIVHEPKLKVDLTAYVEKHDFVFDAVLDEQASNDEVYRVSVQPIIPTIFQRTKATCFAYGQTGSGKTYTMQPLPLRACQDMLDLMQSPVYKNEGFQLWLNFFLRSMVESYLIF
ncbi:hypothetical protein KP509_08G068000 [Ceratopteris richardii]|uniref:Kinesin motor domain-containing protein n=1 Tax=Ceratopteris richardii TaxID=49495 RepID=A0A8T2UE68_CERRI|nr:hypothetical protein KP509_08G068000 [Ceratopteris richardii]